MASIKPKIRNRQDLYDCFAMWQQGLIKTKDLVKECNRVKNLNYDKAVINEISSDRKTVNVNYLAEADEGSAARVGSVDVIVKSVTHNQSEPDEHGNYSTVVYCNIEVTQERRYFGDGDYTITFSPECSDLGESEEDEIINNTFVVKFHKYEGKYRLLWLGSLDCFTLNRLPAFALYLQAAKDARCEIEIDMSSDQDDVEIDIER